VYSWLQRDAVLLGRSSTDEQGHQTRSLVLHRVYTTNDYDHTVFFRLSVVYLAFSCSILVNDKFSRQTWPQFVLPSVSD